MMTKGMKKERLMNAPNERKFFALGTLNQISVYCIGDDGVRDQAEQKLSEIEAVLDQAEQRVWEIEAMMSAFTDESDIARINQFAGKEMVKIHPETMGLIKKAITFSILSDGAFDITVKPLVELWGIGRKNNEIPSRKEIDCAKGLVDYRKILLDEGSCRAGLKDKGQAIDLGGIAKGYAAEAVKRVLIENKVHSALINLGGNILTMGRTPDGGTWKIGIQNPVKPTGNYLGILDAEEKTLVTSGSNERFFIRDGRRYHHIIDPRTGEPSQSGLLSITAVCGCSADADALTTAVFVLGPENGMKLIQLLGAEAVFVTEKLEVLASEGLRNHFELLNHRRI